MMLSMAFFVTGSLTTLPSASSYFDLRVEGFELGACVVDCELPIDTSLPVVAGSGPGIRFCSKFVDIYDAAILQALTRHGAEFVL